MGREKETPAFWASAADYGRRPAPHPHAGPRRWLPSVKLVAAHRSYDLMIRLPASRRRCVMIPLFAPEDSA